MNHLYDEENTTEVVKKAFCGKGDISPGSDSFPARLGQTLITELNICKGCLDSSSYSLWLLKSLYTE